MTNKNQHIEIEDKFLLKKSPVDISWDTCVLVYQFFYENDDSRKFSQDKLVINMSKGTVSFCTITKEILAQNKSIKKGEYKSIHEIDLKSFIGRPFVMKRRHIKGNLFFDAYIYGNYPEKREKLWMLEIEHEGDVSIEEYKDLFGFDRCVSNSPEFYNENMTVKFTERELNEFFELCRILVNK